MKLSHKIAAGLSLVAAASVVVYFIRKSRTRHMLNKIADEGYETAQDILFPGQRMEKKLHYGPVIPQ